MHFDLVIDLLFLKPMNALTLRWSGHTDCGRVRTNNEDSFLGLVLDAQEIHLLGKIGEAPLNHDDRALSKIAAGDGEQETTEHRGGVYKKTLAETSTDATQLSTPTVEFGERSYVFAVCDGLGGAKAGEFASRIAVEKITKMFPKYLSEKKLPNEKEISKTTDLLIELFHEIHRALILLSASYDECHGMGTTLTLCWLRPHHCTFAHIGDSRLYHLPSTNRTSPLSKLADASQVPGSPHAQLRSVHDTLEEATPQFAVGVEFSTRSIQQLSEDDTHVGWLFRQGKINEREAKYHQGRNLLQKALGADHQFVTPQVGSFTSAPGDRLLLCTDGVTDGLFNHQLWNILNHPTQTTPARHLVEEAVIQSGRDNATAIVIEIL